MLPAIPSILDLHFDSSIRRHPQTKLRARTRATLRLARVCPRAVIQPVVSTFAVVKRVWKSHLVLYLRETGNRLCPRVNTDASKTPHLPKFSKTSTINETENRLRPYRVRRYRSCVFTKIIFAFDHYSHPRQSQTHHWEVSSREVQNL